MTFLKYIYLNGIIFKHCLGSQYSQIEHFVKQDGRFFLVGFFFAGEGVVVVLVWFLSVCCGVGFWWFDFFLLLVFFLFVCFF